MNKNLSLAFALAAAALQSGGMVSALSAQAKATPQVDSSASAAKAKPVFENGQAQIVPEFADPTQWIQEVLWVESEFDSDGDGKKDRIFVSVTRQKQTATEGLKVPVIYESSPYYSGIAPSKSYFWNVKHPIGGEPASRSAAPSISYTPAKNSLPSEHARTWVPRGFAVVHSEAPGTGLSQGCSPMGAPHEALAPKAVINWLNGKATGYKTADGFDTVTADWTTGNVGMTGTSYNGTLALAAATTGVEGLKAIIPVAPLTSYYHYYRSFGLVRSPGGYLGEDIDVLYDAVNSGDPAKRDLCNSIIRDGQIKAGIDRVKGDYNDFWQGRDYLNGVKNIKAAVLMAHAFNDWNVMPEHSVRIYDALKETNVPRRIYFHQGGHGGPPPLEHMNRWFTRYLYDVENSVEKDPKSWVIRENVRANTPTPYAEYPNPDAQDVEFFIAKGGNKNGELSLTKQKAQGTEKFTDDVSISATMLAQADSSENRLMYVSPVLKNDLHLSGWSNIKLSIASNAPTANLSVYLVIVGRGSVITRGWADPQNYKSLRESEPLKSGKFYDMSFYLQPDDQIIPAGSRIALMVFSSDKDFTLWPPAGTELTLDLDKVSLKLPVVGGKKAVEAAFKAE